MKIALTDPAASLSFLGVLQFVDVAEFIFITLLYRADSDGLLVDQTHLVLQKGLKFDSGDESLLR